MRCCVVAVVIVEVVGVFSSARPVCVVVVITVVVAVVVIYLRLQNRSFQQHCFIVGSLLGQRTSILLVKKNISIPIHIFQSEAFDLC